jgi:hypothetical protein
MTHVCDRPRELHESLRQLPCDLTEDVTLRVVKGASPCGAALVDQGTMRDALRSAMASQS